MPHGRENANLVESVLFFLIGKVAQLDSFECVLGIIDQSLDLVDAAVGPLTKLLQYLKLFY